MKIVLQIIGTGIALYVVGNQPAPAELSSVAVGATMGFAALAGWFGVGLIYDGVIK